MLLLGPAHLKAAPWAQVDQGAAPALVTAHLPSFQGSQGQGSQRSSCQRHQDPSHAIVTRIFTEVLQPGDGGRGSSYQPVTNYSYYDKPFMNAYKQYKFSIPQKWWLQSQWSLIN